MRALFLFSVLVALAGACETEPDLAVAEPDLIAPVYATEPGLIAPVYAAEPGLIAPAYFTEPDLTPAFEPVLIAFEPASMAFEPALIAPEYVEG